MSNSKPYQIHKLSDVQTTKIGENTSIWQYSVILKGAVIGTNCNINCHCFIENDVVIGNNVTIKSGVYLWDGLRIDDNAFIGPNVTFTNDTYPRSKRYPKSFNEIRISQGASIGANATILGGVIIGKFALIGAGSLIVKSIPDHALVYGNPAKIKGWVDKNGAKMKNIGTEWFSESGIKFKEVGENIVEI